MNIGEDGNRRERPCRVADAKLVKHVRVGQCEVGDYVLGKQQPGEHRSMNDSARALLIAPYCIESRRQDRRFDGVVVNLVKIDLDAGGRVLLLLKRHVHETECL